VILARIELRRLAEPPARRDAGEPLRDLERRLDEAFLLELRPALDEARRARASSPG